ncbi:MAG: hypothetical protein ABGZ24_22900 [Fuerstiella sp.]
MANDSEFYLNTAVNAPMRHDNMRQGVAGRGLPRKTRRDTRSETQERDAKKGQEAISG